ncbi:MAG: carbohydrate-binding protein, partial [Muribaculaceae bacterium]|nr:carbohydrate-binding protein [Muribaculaceae bacterium]
SGRRGGTIEVRTDSISGPIIATIDIPGTGGWEKWQYIESPIQRHPQGTHGLYFVFKGRKGPELFNLDYWILK